MLRRKKLGTLIYIEIRGERWSFSQKNLLEFGLFLNLVKKLVNLFLSKDTNILLASFDKCK